jgi:predicted DNA binding protein
MSVLAEFSIPADQFALGQLLEVRPGVRIRLESMVPTGDAVIPYLWVRSPDAGAVREALRGSAIVESAHVLDEVDDETLFRVDWSGEVNGFVGAIRETRAVVLEGEGHGDRWSFQLRFPEYDALSAFHSDVVDRGVSVELEGVHNPIESPSPESFGLSSEQYEALELALERGYFAVPREVTMVELAGELGISDSATSQRLRRGLAQVLSGTIARGRSTS